MTNIVITTAAIVLTLTVPTGAAVQVITNGQSQTMTTQANQAIAVEGQPVDQIQVIIQMPSFSPSPSVSPAVSPSPSVSPSTSPAPLSSVNPLPNQFTVPSPQSMTNQVQIPQPKQFVPVGNS